MKKYLKSSLIWQLLLVLKVVVVVRVADLQDCEIKSPLEVRLEPKSVLRSSRACRVTASRLNSEITNFKLQSFKWPNSRR